MQILLLATERNLLKQRHRSAKDKRSADRIKIILLLDKGHSSSDIAAILLLDEDMIHEWMKKYKSSSTISDFIKENYTAFYGKLDSQELAEVRGYFREHIITDAKRVIVFVKERYGIIHPNICESHESKIRYIPSFFMLCVVYLCIPLN